MVEHELIIFKHVIIKKKLEIFDISCFSIVMHLPFLFSFLNFFFMGLISRDKVFN